MMHDRLVSRPRIRELASDLPLDGALRWLKMGLSQGPMVKTT